MKSKKNVCQLCLFQAVMLWVRHDPVHRRQELDEILPCIRLGLCDPSFLQEAMNCDDYALPDMKHCFEYLSNIHQNLTSHRCCQLPAPRAPIKPLVICKSRRCNQSERHVFFFLY